MVRAGLASLLTLSTLTHLFAPRLFLGMIPAWVPGARRRVHAVVTVVEGVTAVLLWRRRTAPVGGALAFLTFLGVLPANLEAVRRGGYDAAPGWLGGRTAAVLRVPLQLPLLWWAWQVATRR